MRAQGHGFKALLPCSVPGRGTQHAVTRTMHMATPSPHPPPVQRQRGFCMKLLGYGNSSRQDPSCPCLTTQRASQSGSGKKHANWQLGLLSAEGTLRRRERIGEVRRQEQRLWLDAEGPERWASPQFNQTRSETPLQTEQGWRDPGRGGGSRLPRDSHVEVGSLLLCSWPGSAGPSTHRGQVNSWRRGTPL